MTPGDEMLDAADPQTVIAEAMWWPIGEHVISAALDAAERGTP